VGSTQADLRTLERLIPTDHGLTVFDAETQETSYGVCVVDGLPRIFDTHRKEGSYVATIELLTEVAAPIRLSATSLQRFLHRARAAGLLPIPYSGCFFKKNLHVYTFRGSLRGLDLSALGRSVGESERKLVSKTKRIASHLPPQMAHAQRDMLDRRRPARYAADLEVLRRVWKER
jgi:hypothetical protein